MKEIKTVALVGLGAIGAYFADRLQPVLGDDLRVIAGGARAERIRREGLVINGKQEYYHVVEPGEGEKSCIAIVPDDQLSLAIGKEGQNARLAARLTGWHIDIKPQSFQGASLVDVEMDDEVEEDDGFCIFVDEDGNRCRNHARPNSQYCGVHADAEAEA